MLFSDLTVRTLGIRSSNQRHYDGWNRDARERIVLPGSLDSDEFRLHLDNSNRGNPGQVVVDSQTLLSSVPAASSLIYVSLRADEAVISASVGVRNGIRRNAHLFDPALITLKRPVHDLHGEKKCVAWDGDLGRWMEDICLVKEANLTHVGCTCSRLTR